MSFERRMELNKIKVGYLLGEIAYPVAIRQLRETGWFTDRAAKEYLRDAVENDN